MTNKEHKEREWEEVLTDFMQNRCTGAEFTALISIVSDIENEAFELGYADGISNPNFDDGIRQARLSVIEEAIRELEDRQFEEPYTLGINYAIGRLQALKTNNQ